MGLGFSRLKCFFWVVAILMAAVGSWPRTATADEDTHASPGVMEKIWAERFSIDFRTLTYGVAQEPANSSQNPSNNFLQMAHYVTVLELRPDMRLNLDPLDLSAKPRMRLDYSFWQEGIRKGESRGDDDWFVNEWLARLKARENLFLSYGRENLQWGPSFLFSPSNPFFQDNGRRNPYLEVPGMDFGRLVWIPHSSWTVSFIANTNEGLNKTSGPGIFLASSLPPPFEKTYALKIDYTGRQNYASMILSHREGFNDSFSFFGGWTISDAVLLYAEGVVTQGSEALYPKKNSSPFGASMQQFYLDSSAVRPVVLIGGSYTFEAKGTLTMEYAYYSPGYSDAQAESYYPLRRKAGQAFQTGQVFSLGSPLSGLGQMTLGQTADTGLRLLRRNYALLQYTQNNIKNVLDLTLRWTQNLDDGSGQFTAVLAYSLGKHLELFTVGTATAGGKNTEFGSILDYQCMIGVKYTY
jgi:hypothetical protein